MPYNYQSRKSEGDLRRRLHQPSAASTTSPSDCSDDTGDEHESVPFSGSGPTTYIVMCINSGAKPEALRWLVDKTRGKRDEGGAELIVRQQMLTEKGQV